MSGEGETGDQCAWWFGSFKADSCELRGLRRRDEHDTKTLCSAAERDRENCTGNFDAAVAALDCLTSQRTWRPCTS
eukprot:4957378-Amphidinium_carterae.1